MKELKGYIMVAGAAVFWGGSATAAKFLLNHQIDTITLVQTRVTFAVLLLLPVLLLLRRHELRIPPRAMGRFLLLGVVGIASCNFTYYYTIKESTVATGILIQYTAPIVVLGYASWRGEEQFTLVKVLAALISLAGCFLAVGAYDLRVLKISPLGLFTGVLSIVTFVFLTVYTRRLVREFSTWSVMFYATAGASLFWCVVHPPWIFLQQEAADLPWASLFMLSVISILIPNTLYFSGLRLVVPSRAIITSTLEPIVAIVSAAAILGEGLTAIQAVGAVLVVSAILLLQVRRESEPVAQYLRKETARASR